VNRDELRLEAVRVLGREANGAADWLIVSTVLVARAAAGKLDCSERLAQLSGLALDMDELAERGEA